MPDIFDTLEYSSPPRYIPTKNDIFDTLEYTPIQRVPSTPAPFTLPPDIAEYSVSQIQPRDVGAGQRILKSEYDPSRKQPLEAAIEIAKPVPALAAAGILEAGAGAAILAGAEETAKKWQADIRIVREQVEREVPLKRDSWSEAARNAFVSLYTQAPAYAIGILTGGTTIPLTAMSAQAGLQKVSELTEGGVSKGRAAVGGVISGGAEYLTEKLPFDAFVGIIRKNKAVGKSLIKMLIGEQIGEQGATAVDSAIDKVSINKGMDWNEYLKRVESTAKTTLIQSAAMGGAAATIGGRQQVTPPIPERTPTPPSAVPTAIQKPDIFDTIELTPEMMVKPAEELARPVMPNETKINAITKGEAVERLAKGDKTVLPHIEEGVKNLGNNVIADEVYNKALGKAVTDKTLSDFRKVESEVKETIAAQPSLVEVQPKFPETTIKKPYKEGFEMIDEIRAREAEAKQTQMPFEKKPKSKAAPKLNTLADFVRAEGGLSTTKESMQGALRRFSIKEGYNLLNNKTGKSFDRMAEAATEAGYFRERPDVNEFINALESDIGAKSAGTGQAVYAAEDEDAAFERKLEEYLSREGGGLPIEEAKRRFLLSEELRKEFLAEQPLISVDAMKKVTKAVEEIFVQGLEKRNKDLLLIDQITDILSSGKIALPQFETILKNNGLTMFEFGRALTRLSARYAGQLLNTLSQMERRLNKLGQTETDKRLLDDLVGGAQLAAEEMNLSSYIKRLDNVRRGLMVTQMATAMRNFETQVGRLGVEGLTDAVDYGIQKALGRKTTNLSPLNGFERILNLFYHSRNKKITGEILKNLPRQYNQLFAIYAGELSRVSEKTGFTPSDTADKILTNMEKSTQVLNTLNSFQEYAIRRTVFLSDLELTLNTQNKTILGRKGMEVVKDLQAIPLENIKKAVTHSLKMTFAEMPTKGTFGRSFIDFINHPKLAFISTLPIPFPRFMVNALKFQFEYSPLGFMKLLSAKERAAIRGGNVSTLSRAAVGTAMFMIALQMRDSEDAGEKWYEYKGIDWRPFNPFASHLFMADIYNKWRKGNLHSLTSKDIALGILSVNMRAGTGLYIFDNLLQGIAKHKSFFEKSKQAAKELAGQVASGFLIPLTQIQDALAGFEATTVKDTKEEPLLGPMKSKVPIISETLRPAYLPTQERPIMKEAPLLRQLTGVSVLSPKNPVQKELDRLGFERNEILPASGFKELDYLTAKYMGALVERDVVPKITTVSYKNLTDAGKGVYLKKEIEKVRSIARKKALKELPDIEKERKIKAKGWRERLLKEEIEEGKE